MSDFIQLKCTNCGGELTENPQDKSYSCKSCHAKYVLKFEHGGIQIERILDSKLEGVQASVSVLASEMAIQRLREDVNFQNQVINELEVIENKQEKELHLITSSMGVLKDQIERARDEIKSEYPKQSKYDLAKPVAICTFLWFVFILLLASENSGDHDLLEIIVALLALFFAIKAGSVYIARAKFRNDEEQNSLNIGTQLTDQYDILNQSRIAMNKSREETQAKLLLSKKELAEKQKELEWHLQNVKSKHI